MRILAVPCVVLLSACASVPAEAVRIVDWSPVLTDKTSAVAYQPWMPFLSASSLPLPPDCKFLATVSGFDTLSATVGDEAVKAAYEARKRAARQGANAMTVTEVSTTMAGTTVTVQAFRCPEL